MSEQNPVRTRSEAELRRIAKLGADELGWEATAEQVVAFAAEHLGATSSAPRRSDLRFLASSFFVAN